MKRIKRFFDVVEKDKRVQEPKEWTGSEVVKTYKERVEEEKIRRQFVQDANKMNETGDLPKQPIQTQLNIEFEKIDYDDIRMPEFVKLTIVLIENTIEVEKQKEDFEMACVPEVPAQKEAVEYLKKVAEQFPQHKLRLGGHSKGGNLAIYASVFAPEEIRYQRAEEVAAIGVRQYLAGESVAFDLLEPEYMRMAEAERKLRAKQEADRAAGKAGSNG